MGSTSGSRQKMVESRELLLAATMAKGLSQYVDQSAMAVHSWKNRDKISTAFLLELPGPNNLWSSAEWGEALCLLLALPSNACSSVRNLGQPIDDWSEICGPLWPRSSPRNSAWRKLNSAPRSGEGLPKFAGSLLWTGFCL